MSWSNNNYNNGKDAQKETNSDKLLQLEFSDPTPVEDQIPLQNTWKFWHDKFKTGGSTAKEYKKLQTKLWECRTVQKFWWCFNSLPPGLPAKFSYHMMRDDVEPIWEDPANKDGGAWVFRFPKVEAFQIWKEICVSIIGEQFTSVLSPLDDQINGSTLSAREKDSVLELWNKRSENKYTVLERLKKVLPEVEFPSDFGKNIFYRVCRDHISYDKTYSKFNGENTNGSNNNSDFNDSNKKNSIIHKNNGINNNNNNNNNNNSNDTTISNTNSNGNTTTTNGNNDSNKK